MGDSNIVWGIIMQHGGNCIAREMKVYCNKRNCIAILVLYCNLGEIFFLIKIKSNQIK